MVLPVSPKMGVGNNCIMFNVYDIVPRVRRKNRTNQPTLNFSKLTLNFCKGKDINFN